MGKPKESLPFLDNTLLGRTAEMLLDCTHPVIVVGRGNDQGLPPLPLELEIVHDHDPGAGPLAALVTGLRTQAELGDLADDDAVFVTGCDAPFLSDEAVGWLAAQLGDHQVVMPKANDRLQPLCAVYRMSVLETAEKLLAEGIRTPRTLAERAHCRILSAAELKELDADLRFLRSVNTPEEYDRAVEDAKAAG